MKQGVITIKKRNLVLNRIQTPDGTTLTSYHIHDYKSHLDANGCTYMLDGGLYYVLYGKSDIKAPDAEDLCLYDDADFEIIRQVHCRGGRGKNFDQPLKYYPIAIMSNEWLEKAIIYNKIISIETVITTILYQKELKYRKKHNIFIKD